MPDESLPTIMRTHYLQTKQRVEGYLNSCIKYRLYRWIVAGVLSLLFILRIVLTGGYYMIAYFLYIYILSAFLSFIKPAEDEDISALPVSSVDTDEYRPYTRALPEFDFWIRFTVSHAISLFAALMPFLNVPVYAPVLILYALVLTLLYISSEFKRWSTLSLNPKQTVKHWIGLDKPKYKTAG